MAVTPIINFPTNNLGYSTNLVNQTIQGLTHSSTTIILINGKSEGVNYTSGATEWQFTTTLNEGENIFDVTAVDTLNIVSSPARIKVTLTSEDNLNLIVSSPTGMLLDRTRDSIIISIIENPEEEVIGYNFYGSEEVGGGTKGFTLLNRSLIKDSSFFKEEKRVLNESVETSGDIKTTTITEQINTYDYYSYNHNRINQPLGNKPISELNHYVVTAVGFDPITQQMVESPYSGELGSYPIILDTSIRDLKVRSTTDVQQSYIDQILTSNNLIDVKPGTLTRDIHINPPSDEFERLYTIINFMHRSQSFLTLIQFDDSDGDGISDPVLQSEKKIKLKEALLLSDDKAQEVQDLIDDSFEKLAGNVNVYRKSALDSVGQVLFYTRSAPTQDVTINTGGIIETLSDDSSSSVQFKVLTDFTLRASDLENYYNPATARYEILLDVQATVSGSEGNVDADKIKVILSGIDPIFGVTNPNPTEFGQDQESNTQLAQRAILAFVSVDVGTEGGYLATTLGTPHVSRAKIISAGESLMMRDIDPLRLVHTFGMVDIYVHGSKQTTVSENFGFSFKSVRSEQALIQSVDLFHFRIQNPDVTYEKPIYDVLEVTNITKSASYDLTGFKIVNDGQVIDLDENLPGNQLISLDPLDRIMVSYRYRESEPYVFLKQPVETIVSVVGEISGSLTSANFELRKTQDPLQFGNSTSSTDQMKLLFANGVPSGEVLKISDEQILLFGENEVDLSRFGVDNSSIVVSDTLNATTYIRDIDYEVIKGTTNTFTKIKRTSNSSIPSGNSVYVDYSAGENLTVSYNTNSLLNDVQSRIDTMRHLTADVVVKGAIKTFIDLDMKVVIEERSDQTSIDRKIRTAVAKILRDKQIGESIYQSDVIRAVENITGVSHVVIPFTKMIKSNNSYVIREPYNGAFNQYQTVNTTSYKSAGKLSWATTAGGGSNSLFRGVFENDIPFTMVDSASAVADQASSAYIDQDGYLFISPKLGIVKNAKITTTYVVQNATGSRDIEFCEIEYGAIGTLTITFDYIKKFRGF